MVANEASLVVPGVVNDAVVKIAAEAGFKKPRFHFESGSNDGDGYTSVIYRAIIQDEEGKKDELRLICKTTAGDVTPEGHMMQFMFDAEAEMYNKFLPALESVAKLQAPLPWPKAYHVWTGTPRPCLVVADKGPEAFRMADRRVPLDEKHLRLALTQLATFHGASMALEKLRPDEFDAIAARRTEAYRGEEVRNVWRSFMAGVVETPEKMVDRFPEGSEINLKLKRFCSTFIDEFFERRITPDKGVGNSMIHGDCHTNNILFQYDKAGAVTGCCLIDFQTTRYSSTTQDLSTLLLACTDRASRKHLDALLKHYHTVLQATLRAAGIKDPDSVYSWDQFMSQFTSVAGYGLFLAPLLIHAFHAELDKVKELQGSVANLLNESDVQPAQAAFTINWTATVKQRVGDLVEDMVARGWL